MSAATAEAMTDVPQPEVSAGSAWRRFKARMKTGFRSIGHGVSYVAKATWSFLKWGGRKTGHAATATAKTAGHWGGRGLAWIGWGLSSLVKAALAAVFIVCWAVVLLIAGLALVITYPVSFVYSGWNTHIHAVPLFFTRSRHTSFRDWKAARSAQNTAKANAWAKAGTDVVNEKMPLPVEVNLTTNNGDYAEIRPEDVAAYEAARGPQQPWQVINQTAATIMGPEQVVEEAAALKQRLALRHQEDVDDAMRSFPGVTHAAANPDFPFSDIGSTVLTHNDIPIVTAMSTFEGALTDFDFSPFVRDKLLPKVLRNMVNRSVTREEKSYWTGRLEALQHWKDLGNKYAHEHGKIWMLVWNDYQHQQAEYLPLALHAGVVDMAHDIERGLVPAGRGASKRTSSNGGNGDTNGS